MTYRLSDFGTEGYDRLIALVRENLTPAEIGDLIGTRSEPWEHDWYAAYAHNNPKLISGPMLRQAIDAYLDCGPDSRGRSAHDDDFAATTNRRHAG
ncbi:hypothetical protein OG552_10680 [Streptomyces sp. NBC_01476]|uniref:hypothetical protein n=1 Tax=Streptomyces sp. NBC_01476 TaxID=2903881 RepID=UPI002E31AA6E|nr:hypothetical protein [Streptomyces sp. NBC_01476]